MQVWFRELVYWGCCYILVSFGGEQRYILNFFKGSYGFGVVVKFNRFWSRGLEIKGDVFLF